MEVSSIFPVSNDVEFNDANEKLKKKDFAENLVGFNSIKFILLHATIIIYVGQRTHEQICRYPGTYDSKNHGLSFYQGIWKEIHK